ncbi:isoprenoid synthase domain-containing protein [Mycena belliarum]|uniref:Terpene synthase n=1 Tax=Mycena belliarum TaxID=1033014 RepID=A0AAD6TX48_9AGAR|nr:isoprenoid synthase domain-containing protein [Mycena belliae]
MFQLHGYSLPATPSQTGISTKTKAWFLKENNPHYDKQCESFSGLNPALLASVVYPDAGRPQLRVCSDFLAYLFFLDDLSDGLDDRDTSSVGNIVLNSFYHPDTFQSPTRLAHMSKDLFKRIRQTSRQDVQRRFIEAFDFFLQSVNDQAKDRTSGVIPTLEHYILLRRDTSGCRPCWAMIEYANNLNIPDDIIDHPVIIALGDAANDLVAWSNDLFSYSVEQSKGDTHNMVVIVMHHNGLDLPDAARFVVDMCLESIARFIRLKAQLPSLLGPSITRDVNIYVQGLESWMCGILYWAFITERYFGKAVNIVRATMAVEIRA